MRALLSMLVALVLVPASAARADKAASATTMICFVPLGPHDESLLAAARAGAEYLYAAQTRVLPAHPLPHKAYYPPRKRYRADTLLDVLTEEVAKASGCDLVVGFTAKDISVTKGQHADWGILGLGTLGGTACVVSSYRMRRKASRYKQKQRAIKVTNHEIGHVLGAPHGGEPGCLMEDAAGTIATVDREHGLLCEDSRAIIERRLGRELPRPERFDWKLVLK